MRNHTHRVVDAISVPSLLGRNLQGAGSHHCLRGTPIFTHWIGKTCSAHGFSPMRGAIYIGNRLYPSTVKLITSAASQRRLYLYSRAVLFLDPGGQSILMKKMMRWCLNPKICVCKNLATRLRTMYGRLQVVNLDMVLLVRVSTGICCFAWVYRFYPRKHTETVYEQSVSFCVWQSNDAVFLCFLFLFCFGKIDEIWEFVV